MYINVNWACIEKFIFNDIAQRNYLLNHRDYFRARNRPDLRQEQQQQQQQGVYSTTAIV